MNKAASLLLMLIVALVTASLTTAMRKNAIEDKSLSLTGHVISVEKISEDASSVGFKVGLRLTFRNIGSNPIIIYRDSIWLGAALIARSSDDASAAKYLHRSSAWPSVWGKSSRVKLRQKLDQPIPPQDITKILKPGESYEYETGTHLGFEKKERYDGTSKAWDEIKLASPVWIQVTLEMWPINAEPKVNPENPEFGKELRERWKDSGELWLDYLTSQPMKLDLVSSLK
jgi:hypothetical protein